MKVVFYGSLIHPLTDTLLAKLTTPWTATRFLEKDAKEDFARALAHVDRMRTARTRAPRRSTTCRGSRGRACRVKRFALA